jgi:hypothetical protein
LPSLDIQAYHSLQFPQNLSHIDLNTTELSQSKSYMLFKTPQDAQLEFGRETRVPLLTVIVGDVVKHAFLADCVLLSISLLIFLGPLS